MSSKSMKYGSALFHKIFPEWQSPWSRTYLTSSKRGVMASQIRVTIVSNRLASSIGTKFPSFKNFKGSRHKFEDRAVTGGRLLPSPRRYEGEP